MSRLLRSLLPCLMAGLAAVVSLAACSSDNFYRGRADVNGQGSAQVFKVDKNGVETPVTNRYTVTGRGTATAQTVKPYLTLDGSWQADQTPAASSIHEDPDAVILRSAQASSGDAIPVVKCDGKPALLIPLDSSCANGSCPIPQAAPVARPNSEAGHAVPNVSAPRGTSVPPSVNGGCPLRAVLGGAPVECGQAVYRRPGCAAGEPPTQVNNPSTSQRLPAPGQGWPCHSPAVDGVLGVAMAGPAFLAHAGGCFVNFLGCVFTP